MTHKLEQLVIYEELIKDPILNDYQVLIRTSKNKKRTSIYYELVRKLLSVGMNFHEYLYLKLLESKSSMLEMMSHEEYELTELDYACLKNDLTIINYMVHYDLSEIMKSVDNPHNLMSLLLSEGRLDGGISAYHHFYKGIDDKPIFHEQCDAYVGILRTFGIGQYASHFAFYLNQNKSLVPIDRYEPLGWDHIYDYGAQKEKLLRNTKALVEGRPFHHSLLVGASGTGKSSSVKAVVELFSEDKLRLIQLYKGQLKNLPKLLEALSKSIFKFIVFIDELSFEVNEDEYKFLKSFIEGGISNEATNVAFYVTSNRRHLIKEVRSEREGDIHTADFIQEMTSLSGRFGLNLTFEGLAQPGYFKMIHKMLDDEGIEYDLEDINREAKMWSMRQGGMSGRIANQFVKHVQMIRAD